MTAPGRRKQDAPAAGQGSRWLGLVQGALAITLFCLLTGLWAALWISLSLKCREGFLWIWPFFHAVGVMLDFAVNLGEVERVSAAFPWAVGALVLMAVSGMVLVWLARRQAEQALDDACLALLKRP